MPRNILEVIYQPKKSWYPGSSKTHLQAKVVWNMFPIYFEYFSSWAELWFVFVFIFIFVSIFVFKLYLYGSPWYVWVLKLPTSLKKLFLFWPHWFQPKYCENLICTFIFQRWVKYISMDSNQCIWKHLVILIFTNESRYLKTQVCIWCEFKDSLLLICAGMVPQFKLKFK